jgi:hypothetical protein
VRGVAGLRRPSGTLRRLARTSNGFPAIDPSRQNGYSTTMIIDVQKIAAIMMMPLPELEAVPFGM